MLLLAAVVVGGEQAASASAHVRITAHIALSCEDLSDLERSTKIGALWRRPFH